MSIGEETSEVGGSVAEGDLYERGTRDATRVSFVCECERNELATSGEQKRRGRVDEPATSEPGSFDE